MIVLTHKLICNRIIRNMAETLWKPLDLSGEKLLNFKKYAVLVLNRPIGLPREHVISVWKEASFRIAADGGLNRWMEFCESVPDNCLPEKYPHIVSGDFDSATEENLQRASQNGTKVIKTIDQDKTDFTKALELLAENQEGKIDTVVVLAENSGRLDQTLSNINTLYGVNDIFSKHPVSTYILASDTLTWLLPPGRHCIKVPEILVKQRACCGLLPLGKASIVSTTGLEWNLDNTKCEFGGGCVSSSNTYKTSDVTVVTNEAIVWTMCLGLNSD